MQNITLTPRAALIFGAVVELYRNKIDDPTDADIYDALGSVALKLIDMAGVRRQYLLAVSNDEYRTSAYCEVRKTLEQYTALRIQLN